MLNSFNAVNALSDDGTPAKSYDERTKDPNDPYYVISDEELEKLNKEREEERKGRSEDKDMNIDIDDDTINQ